MSLKLKNRRPFSKPQSSPIFPNILVRKRGRIVDCARNAIQIHHSARDSSRDSAMSKLQHDYNTSAPTPATILTNSPRCRNGKVKFQPRRSPIRGKVQLRHHKHTKQSSAKQSSDGLRRRDRATRAPARGSRSRSSLNRLSPRDALVCILQHSITRVIARYHPDTESVSHEYCLGSDGRGRVEGAEEQWRVGAGYSFQAGFTRYNCASQLCGL